MDFSAIAPGCRRILKSPVASAAVAEDKWGNCTANDVKGKQHQLYRLLIQDILHLFGQALLFGKISLRETVELIPSPLYISLEEQLKPHVCSQEVVAGPMSLSSELMLSNITQDQNKCTVPTKENKQTKYVNDS